MDLKWTWRVRRDTADSFDGFLRSICFSCALLVVYSDFQLISGITFALTCFLYQFSISDRTVISSNAPKQLVTPEETLQTSAVQFNFSTRLG